MAVGGEPDLSSLNGCDENLQEQNDEILALESIFEGDEGRLEVLSRAELQAPADDADIAGGHGNALKIMIPTPAFGDKLNIDVYLPIEEQQDLNGYSSPTGEGKLARSDSGHRAIWSFQVTYLPPLCLTVTLPPSYPSRDSPSFQLSCLWLSPRQLTCLCGQLDRLWLEGVDGGGQGMPILYTWVDWLQEYTLSSLGIESHLSVSTHEIDDDVDDCRVTIESDDMNYIVTAIMRYNRDREFGSFCDTSHECGICFMEYPGTNFIQLSGCKHHMCTECLTAHCQLIVKEGTVQNLRCPSYECDESISPYTLQKVLTKEEFQRYQELALQKALDTMGDVTWCPRCNSAVVQEPEKNLNLAHCLSCFYSFCTDCQEAWHQGRKCLYLLEMDEKLMEKEKAKKNENLEEHKRLSELKKQNRMSNKYISKMASECPKCSAKIMKTGGCNKVTCSVCLKHMCWCCKKAIDDSYQHFTDNQKCCTFQLADHIDNTDMPLQYQYQNPEAARRIQEEHLRHRERPKVEELEERLRENPDLLLLVLRCCACKVRNIKEGNRNHIVCWNCRSNNCFQCRQRITGPVGRHYHGMGTCDQHS